MSVFGSTIFGVAAAARITSVIEVLRGYAFRFSREEELQRGIERVLLEHRIVHRREAPLGAAGQIDFLLTEGGIGLEVKVGGGLQDLTRQVHRYAQRAELAGVLVVTSLNRHLQLPETFNGKPVRAHRVQGAGL